MTYYHEVPGRLRVKAPHLKGNAAQCTLVQAFIGEQAGITAVSANPLTGSVIVHFDPRVAGAEGIKEQLALHGCFTPAGAVTATASINTATERIGAVIGKAVVSACVEQLFAGSPLSLVSVFL